MEHGSRSLIEEIKDDLFPLVEDQRDGALRSLLIDIHPADIADFIDILRSPDERKYVFGLVQEMGLGSAVLTEMPSTIRERLIEDIPSPELADLVEEMSSDDAADLVQDLPDNIAAEVLQDIEAEDIEALRPLLEYGEDTAGGIMASEVLAIRQGKTLSNALDLVRTKGEEFEPFFFVFVLDEEERLKGTLSLKHLVLGAPETLVEDACDREPVTVPASMDQEEVADIFRRYDLLAAPVVDASGRVLGRITIDDVVDVMREEAEEDIARMAGTDDEEFHEISIRRIVLYRLPWILGSLTGGFTAGVLLDRFAGSIAVGLSLLAFVPVIMAMAGNAGSQAAITMVRTLTLRNLSRREVANILWREARVGLFLGLITGTCMGSIAYLWRGAWYYGAVVGASLAVAILVAATMGTLTPLLFKRLKVDPAIATGPFVSVSNDATALLIYFSVAFGLLRLLGGTP